MPSPNVHPEALRQLLELSPLPMCATEVATGHIVAVNKRMQHFLGRPEEELLGRTTIELGMWDNPDDRRRHIEIIMAQREYVDYEAKLYDGEGSIRDCIMTAMLHEDGENPPLFILAVQDITDRRKAQQDVRDSEEVLQSVVANLHEGIFLVGSDRRIFLANEKACEITGIPRQRLLGREIVDDALDFIDIDGNHVPRDQLPGYLTFADGQPRHDQVLGMPSSGGNRIWLSLNCSVVQRRQDGGVKTLLMSFSDISDKLRQDRALKDSLAKFRMLFENYTSALSLHEVVLDDSGDVVDYRFLEVNPMYERMTGRKASELEGRTFRECMPQIDTRWIQEFGKVAMTGEPLEMQGIASPSGNVFDVKVFSPSKGYFALVMHDVTERVKQSRALAESESRLRMLIDTAPEAIVIFDIEEGHLVQVNRAAERMFGRDAEELLRMGPHELSPPFQPSGIPSVEGAWKHLQEAAEGRTVSFEWVHLGSAGTREILTEMNLSRMPAENKRLVRASIVDITRKRKTESIVETLVKATSSQYGQAYFDTLVHDICALLEVEYAFIERSIDDGARMRTLSFQALGNPATNFEYPTSGSPCADILGKQPLIVRSGIQERYPNARQLADMQAQSYMGVPLFSTRHESLGVLAVVGMRPMEESELAEHILTIFAARAQIEIERLEAEQALRTLNIELEQRVRERTAELQASNRELESFAYSVSHDLRSPLRAIDGFGQALEEDCAPLLDDQGRGYLNRIRHASHRMTDLIDDLLTLSRSSRSALEKSDIDLSSIATEIVGNLRASYPDRTVEVRIDPDLHTYADPVLMRAVLGNLIENSWKYTRNTAHPSIAFRSDRAPEGFLGFAVSDNGAGFDPAHAGKLFGTFQRLHSAEEFEGNGIGLATARRIIERHGGTIAGSGEVGKGATFRFVLPLRS